MTGRCQASLLLGFLALGSAASAEAACTGLRGMDLAKCLVQEQKTAGTLTPGGLSGQQSIVPQFTPGATLPSTQPRGAGNASALTQQGQTALNANALLPQLQRGRQDSKAWNLRGSDALQTAKQTLAAPKTLAGVEKTCSVQEICVARGPGQTQTFSCQEPAAQMHICAETHEVITNVTPGQFEPVDNGSHNANSICPNHWHDASDRFGLSGACIIYRVASYDTTGWPWRFQLCAKVWSRYKGEAFPVYESCVGVPEGEPFTAVTIQTAASGSSECCATTQYAVWASGQIRNGFGEVTFDSGTGHQQTLGFTYVPATFQTAQQTADGQPAPPCAIPPDAPASCRTPQQACTQAATVQVANGVAVPLSCPTQVTYIGCSVPDTCAPYRQQQGCRTVAATCGQIDTQGRCLWYANTYECPSTGACTQTQVIKQCTQCGQPDSLIPFCIDTGTAPNANFAKTAGYLEMVQQIRRNYNETSQTVFDGVVRRCEYTTQAAEATSAATSATIAAGAAALSGGAMGAVVMAAASGAYNGTMAASSNCCELQIENPLKSVGYLATNGALHVSKYGIKYYENLKNTAEAAISTASDSLARARDLRNSTEIVANALNDSGAQGATAVADSLHASSMDGLANINQGNDFLEMAGTAYNAGHYTEATQLAQNATNHASDAASQMNTSIVSADQAIQSGSLGSTLADIGTSIGVSMATQLATSQVMKMAFGGQCDDDDVLLAMERKAGLSVYVGTKCSKSVDLGFGKVCMKKQQVWCSFGSLLARLVQQQGRSGPDPFGIVTTDRDSPDCSGFTLAQFAQLRFDQMNFQELYDKLKPQLNDSAMTAIGTTQASKYISTRQGQGGSTP